MIKELVRDIRHEVGRIFLKDAIPGYFGSFFNIWESSQGKWRPTDFARQVKSNLSWVYACVSAISEAAAMIPINLYVQRGGRQEPVEDHIFWDLWREVNPFMNNFMLREITEVYQLLTGNAYWYMVKDGFKAPSQIWPVPSQYMKIVPEKKNFIKGYIFQQPGSEAIKFEVEEIIHFKYPNPNDMYYGVGPLMAAAYEVDVNQSMNEYQTAIFRNQGIPDAVLQSDLPLGETIRNRMRLEWNQMHKGPDKAGKIAILEKGLKYQQIQLSARELAYIQSKNVNRDTIMAIFRVPPSVLGMVENVNRANAEAGIYTFMLQNVKPKLIRNQEKLNEQLMPMYPQDGNAHLRVEYDDPVPENRELLLKERESRLKTGYASINMEREEDGEKPVKWGTVPIMPMQMIPIGSAAPTPAKPIPKPKDGDNGDGKKTKAIFSRERASILYRQRFDTQTTLMMATMRSLFRDQEKEVLKNVREYYQGRALSKDAADAFLFFRTEAEKEFAERGRPHMEGAYEAGAKHGIRLADLDLVFSLDNPVAQTFLEEKTHRFSFETNDTTIKQLKAELNEGMAEGENMKAISERVKKVFGQAETYRAVRIARTEIAEVENQATEHMWAESGVVEEKEWLHGGGGLDPRPEHVRMNGERVKIGERFSNGMLRPGDPAGGSGNVCNCTCSLLPHVKE